MYRLCREGAVVEGLEEDVCAEDGNSSAETRQGMLHVLALAQPRVRSPGVVCTRKHDASGGRDGEGGGGGGGGESGGGLQ